MSMTTIKSADKIKMLDQMLEDIAGDEFDDFDVIDGVINAGSKQSMQYSDMAVMDIIESMH